MAAENAPYVMNVRTGDTFVRVLTWTNQSNGTAINLTNAIVEWALRNGDVYQQFFTAPQVVITNATAGEITLTLSDAETRAMGQPEFLRKWAYEVTVTRADGSRVTILEGSLRMRDEVAHTDSE